MEDEAEPVCAHQVRSRGGKEGQREGDGGREGESVGKKGGEKRGRRE